MTEKAKLVYKEYKTEMKDIRVRTRMYDRDAARALRRARILGKAANIIWQKNFEAAATRPNRTHKEINEISEIYFTLRDQIQELKFQAEECSMDALRLHLKAYNEAVDRIRKH